MELRDFAEKMCCVVSENLGERYQVQIQEVSKNNGVSLLGLLILNQKQNISPTIYLNAFWEAYETGMPLDELAEIILRIYLKDTPAENVDMSFFRDYGQVKERICYKLVHAGRNERLLQEIPYVEFMDLAICFYYAYEGKQLGSGSILIHNSHLELWDTNIADLMRLARQNTPRLFPWECCPMEKVIRELLEQQGEQGEAMLKEEEQEEFFREMPMEILSNQKHTFGAACILYPGLLHHLAGKLAADKARGCTGLYILPSSIHEVILLPAQEALSRKQLCAMIQEVNETQVEPEEILSDRLYIYRMDTKKIEIV